MKEKELDVASGDVTGYVVVEELVDVFEIPVKAKSKILIHSAIIAWSKKEEEEARPPSLLAGWLAGS